MILNWLRAVPCLQLQWHATMRNSKPNNIVVNVPRHEANISSTTCLSRSRLWLIFSSNWTQNRVLLFAWDSFDLAVKKICGKGLQRKQLLKIDSIPIHIHSIILKRILHPFHRSLSKFSRQTQFAWSLIQSFAGLTRYIYIYITSWLVSISDKDNLLPWQRLCNVLKNADKIICAFIK